MLMFSASCVANDNTVERFTNKYRWRWVDYRLFKYTYNVIFANGTIYMFSDSEEIRICITYE